MVWLLILTLACPCSIYITGQFSWYNMLYIYCRNFLAILWCSGIFSALYISAMAWVVLEIMWNTCVAP